MAMNTPISAAAEPSTCSWVVSGFEPMIGRRRSASVQPDGFSALATRAGGLEAACAGRFVMVDDCAEVGRAAGFFSFAPKSLPKTPPNGDLGFIACAFAITPLLGTNFEETLLAHERGQVELQPTGTARVGIRGAYPRRRPWGLRRGVELFGVAQPEH